MLSPNFATATAAPNLIDQCQIETSSFGKTDDIKPNDSFELNVTLTNRYEVISNQSIDVEVFLEGLPDGYLPWFLPLSAASDGGHYRLALFPQQSQEVSFIIKAKPTAPPQLVNYRIVVRQANQGPVIEAMPLRLRVLPVDRSEVSTESPTFYFEPVASATEPLEVSPLAGLTPIQVWVDNRSERVDSFQLRCEGLPKDWKVTIQYPQAALGTGLMLPATGLSLNPRDRGHIQLIIKPPPTAHAGLYTPTLQVVSANRPTLKLLHLLYIQILPNHQLQPSLNSLRSQFRKGPGRYELQLFNSGNIPRQLSVEVESLEEVERHDYRLKCKGLLDIPRQDVTETKSGDRKEQTLRQIKDFRLLPQQTRLIELEIVPKHRWRRPMFGGGYLSNFRINLADVEGHSLTPTTFQGNTIWMARPWWQLLLAVLLVLGLLGSAAGLIWWFFLRPPAVLSLTPSASKYSAVTNDFAKVDFKLRYANNIQAIRLTGYDSEGKISSAPIAYDFQDVAQQNKMQTDALPHGLKSLCTVQPRRRLLSCNRVHTGASLPGEYVFQLDVIYEHRGEPSTLSEQTVPVAISPIPGPTLSVPGGLIFGEASLWRKEGDPLVDSNGFKILPTGLNLNLDVFHPENFKSIKLVGKTPDGKIFAEGKSRPIWTKDSWTPGATPRLDLNLTAGGTESLMNCERSQHQLSCDKFITQIQTAGNFQIEAIFEPRDNTDVTAPITAITEPITIEPSPISIEEFSLAAPDNEGQLRAVKPKEDPNVSYIESSSYVFFIDPGTSKPNGSPEFKEPPTVNLYWKVLGGKSMTVELLLPDPLTVGDANKREGKFPLLLTPGDRKNIVLRVTDANGNQKTRSIEIEVVGPPPIDPLVVAEETGKALAEALQQNAEQDTNSAERNNADSQTNRPAELPPRFNQ